MRVGSALRCSFCGRDESVVDKLVAGPRQLWIGPRVHICDRCAAEVQEIIHRPSGGDPSARQTGASGA